MSDVYRTFKMHTPDHDERMQAEFLFSIPETFLLDEHSLLFSFSPDK